MLRSVEDNRMVGSGFFQHSRDEGYYAVAVFDRDLFDKPLGHMVQQIAIDHMKSLGLRWYKLGERPYLHNSKIATEKEVNIAILKKDFVRI